jgi:uridine kinase
MRSGAEVTEVPCYDYVTHTVLGPEHSTKIVKPSIVIFEGILAFHDPAVRAMLDMKIFVDTDADTRLSRRIRRDIKERGRDLEGVLTQYERFVKPSFDAFCFPQRNHADVILPRGKENTVAIAMVVENLRTMLVEYECEVAGENMAAGESEDTTV